MKNVGTEVYVFENGVSTMYTLPNAIIYDDMQGKTYIVYTTSKTSFDITMHLGAELGQVRYCRNRANDNDTELIRKFMHLLGSSLWELFTGNDIASIYETVIGDILKFMYASHVDGAKFEYNYFEADDGSVYDIKIMNDAYSFMISAANITPDK
jgi:hypothetical protein